MKRLFLLAAVTFIVACNSLSTTDVKIVVPQRQGWDNEIPLYGDVESVTISEYGVEDKFGEVVKGDLESRVIVKFNEKGDVIEGTQYNSDGSLDSKYIYKYDSKGNIIECTKYRGEIMIPEGLYEYIIVYRK